MFCVRRWSDAWPASRVHIECREPKQSSKRFNSITKSIPLAHLGLLVIYAMWPKGWAACLRGAFEWGTPPGWWCSGRAGRGSTCSRSKRPTLSPLWVYHPCLKRIQKSYMTPSSMILRGDSKKFEYVSENETKNLTILTHCSVAQAGSNDKTKTWSWKSRWTVPLKALFSFAK